MFAIYPFFETGVPARAGMATVVVSPAGSSYQKECVLGSGAFGTILKCKHGDQLESTCVIKRVKLARQTPQERFASVQELAILQQLRHRNLVHGIDGWIESKHTACLVMDYCNGGTLATLLRSRKGEALLENDVCMILVQVRVPVIRPNMTLLFACEQAS